MIKSCTNNSCQQGKRTCNGDSCVYRDAMDLLRDNWPSYLLYAVVFAAAIGLSSLFPWGFAQP